MKTHEEMLREWTLDDIPMYVNGGLVHFTRDSIVGLFGAIQNGHSSYKINVRGVVYNFTTRLFGDMQAQIRTRNLKYPPNFLCRFHTFSEAEYAVTPPDTLLLQQQAERAMRMGTNSGSVTDEFILR